MSLPINKEAQQPSIRSFFAAKAPQYAPPPGSVQAKAPPPPLPALNGSIPSVPSEKQDDTAIPPLPSCLPAEATIRRPLPEDIQPLRRINALLLPVPYPEEFYRQAIAMPQTRVILHSGKVVGGIVCRTEPSDPAVIYIRSLCILAPYRGLGLAAIALDNIMQSLPGHVSWITAHVWTENDDGLKWYGARGFTKDTKPIEGYYRKLRPDTAWLVKKDVRGQQSSSLASRTPPPPRSVVASPTAEVVNLPPMTNGSAPPSGSPPRRAPAKVGSGHSYQNQRPETEWNDLPADMASGLLVPPKRGGGEPNSNASSRSSSAARKKRDRSYPAAAFGS
jgi:N-alpha-acetyltransferase 50